jgi:uncharacterized membrane protein
VCAVNLTTTAARRYSPLCMLSHPVPPRDEDGPAEGGGQPEPGPTAKDRQVPPTVRRRVPCNLLLASIVSLFLIGLTVALLTGGRRYREEFAQDKVPWRVGSTRTVELTLLSDDSHDLACASDLAVAGLRCAYSAGRQNTVPPSPDDRKLLQPYNTTANELLLGAGLWVSPALKQPLPTQRFTVTCTYHVLGILTSVSIRFKAADAFALLDRPIAVGTLTDCKSPR